MLPEIFKLPCFNLCSILATYCFFMKRFFFLAFLISSTSSFSQDTLFLDIDYNKTKSENAVYYRIEDRSSPGEQDLVRTTYRKNGDVLRQRSYLQKGEKLTRHGLQKTWYDNGQLFYQEIYKKGKRHGELVAYWEDGSRRRHDIFKNGKLKSGKIWNRKGEEEKHYPVMIPAEFPGGEKAIADYLRKSFPVPETQKSGTEVRLLVRIRISQDGFVDKIDIIEGAPHWYNAVTTNALLNMPKWNPGSFMGEPINVWYTLPVTFRK